MAKITITLEDRDGGLDLKVDNSHALKPGEQPEESHIALALAMHAIHQYFGPAEDPATQAEVADEE